MDQVATVFYLSSSWQQEMTQQHCFLSCSCYSVWRRARSDQNYIYQRRGRRRRKEEEKEKEKEKERERGKRRKGRGRQATMYATKHGHKHIMRAGDRCNVWNHRLLIRLEDRKHSSILSLACNILYSAWHWLIVSSSAIAVWVFSSLFFFGVCNFGQNVLLFEEDAMRRTNAMPLWVFCCHEEASQNQRRKIKYSRNDNEHGSNLFIVW